MRKLTVSSLAAMCAAGVLCVQVPKAGASNIVWTGAQSNDYAKAYNWSPGVVPGNSDTVYFNNGAAKEAVVSSNVNGTPSTVYLGQGTSGSGAKLQLITNGSLTYDNLYVGRDHTDIGHLYVDGGSLTASTTLAVGNNTGGVSTMEVSAGTVTANQLRVADGSSATAGSSLAITGGTVSVNSGSGIALGIGDNGQTGAQGVMTVSGGNLNWGGAFQMQKASSLTVDGTGATIQATNTGSSITAFTVVGGSSLNFNLGATGVSTIDLGSNKLQVDNTASTLNIDGSQYTGGNGTIVLATYGGLSGNNAFGTTNITGFKGDAALQINNTEMDLVITNTPTTPEPASLALLGLGGLMLMVRRRRSHA